MGFVTQSEPPRAPLGSSPESALTNSARLNPCELEIDLFCKGIRIGESCTLDEDGRSLSRTRAGLGDGLELVIPGPLKDIWMNVPVVEKFARNSCYKLDREGDDYWVIDDRSRARYPVRIPPEPAWYSEITSRGTEMRKVGVLQGTYLGIYLSNACGFWAHSPRMNCRFCTTGLNVGVNEAEVKDIQDVIEVARAAKEQSGVTFIHFNSGYKTNRDLDVVAPYVKAVKTRIGSLIGVQACPVRDFWKYDRLVELGANHFSFCYEFHDPEIFAELCPGKQKYIGQDSFFRALEYTSKILGKGTCSGEIIAGIEPLEWTLKGIDYITSVGAFPTVCIFRPTQGADMQDWPSPRFEDMMVVFRHVYEACRKNNIPVDVTPNIEVSLVVQPGDTRYLAPADWRSGLFNLKTTALKAVTRPYFSWKMRPKNIVASEVLQRGSEIGK